MHISTSKVELYAAIRRDHRAGLSMRALERKYGVTWRTIRKALDSNWPEPRKKQAPRPTRLDPYKPVIDGMLRADLDAPPKQKHTVKRIFDRLLDEHTADGISYQMVRAYVAVRRKEVRWEAGRGPERSRRAHASGSHAREEPPHAGVRSRPGPRSFEPQRPRPVIPSSRSSGSTGR
ncbi:hypothetical protein [Streptomyces sp. NBC_01281]|uniref:hypothetical protein n=1 Tax=Streptomyces sp. NBC_01281 TaxID=2903811 RepID=UPI003DA4ED05